MHNCVDVLNAVLCFLTTFFGISVVKFNSENLRALEARDKREQNGKEVVINKHN